MSTKTKLATLAGKFTKWTLTTFTNGGSSLPGKVALSIDKNILKELAADYEVIIVSGTNGKTLTTSLIVQILKQKYPNILTNPTGANLQQGIVATFLGHSVKKNEKKIAVLEIDEATIKYVTKFIKPKLFVFTNVFRDQMDRFGEIYTTYNLMLEGVKNAPEAIVLSNGDLPIFHSVNIPNPQKFFGFNFEKDREQMAHYNSDGILCPHCHNILHYKSITYSNLGKYYCPTCDFKRPNLDFQVTALNHLSLTGSSFDIDGHTLTIPNAGLYNIYNALAAYSAARIFDLNTTEIQNGFKASKSIFGRQETFLLGDKKVMINLIKNPVGFNQIVQLLQYETEPFSLAILLNDNYADGQDISWIWDGDFEGLHDLDYRDVFLGGLRVNDLALRMEVAGFDHEAQIVTSNEELINQLSASNAPKINILATYTALLDLRKDLAKAGYIKEGMQ